MGVRAAIYARYSSDNQSAASIDDQIRLCRAKIIHENWDAVEIFSDAAISGASTNRPGYQAMMEMARCHGFDILVCEALDRLSRDLEDVAGMYNRLSFANIQLVTLGEGDINYLHVGLKGTMNALFLKDLAQKTRRGLRGRVEAGRSAGGRCYGYDLARRVDTGGELIRGERRINAAEAAIVGRIFSMFAAGMSPIAIAKQLNAEQVTGPQGRAWRDTTIRGHAARGTGILRNELYMGKLVWNRQTYVKAPGTGRRLSRVNPAEQIVTHDVPELRIVEPDLWDRVARRLRAIRATSGADDPNRPRFWEGRRAQHVLSGKVICGCCGGAISNVGKVYLACSAARKQGVCANRRSIQRNALEGLVLDALKTRLMQPEHVATFVAKFTAEWNRLCAERSTTEKDKRLELASVERKLNNLIDAVADGMHGISVQGKIASLEAQQASLRQHLSSATPTMPALPPNLSEVYRRKVGLLQTALAGADNTEARDRVRDLIDHIVLTPSAAGSGFEIELVGEISAMLGLTANNTKKDQNGVAVSDPGLFDGSIKVVAGTGFEPVTFRL